MYGSLGEVKKRRLFFPFKATLLVRVLLWERQSTFFTATASPNMVAVSPVVKQLGEVNTSYSAP